MIDCLIQQIDTLLGTVKAYVKQQHAHVFDSWSLDFHVYGKGHTDRHGGLGELFVVAEVLASSQKVANSIASMARVGLIVSPTDGRSVGGLHAKRLIRRTACTVSRTESNFR